MEVQNIDENDSPVNINDVLEVIVADSAFSAMEGVVGKGDNCIFVKVVEQPAIRYNFCYGDGQVINSLPGVTSTPDNITCPVIQIVGYVGRAVIVVSCVTNDRPHRPHPHNLVGDGCKRGICSLRVTNEDMLVPLSNIGIQAVIREAIEKSLSVRESIRVDPFRTGFVHKSQPNGIDLNTVRLAIQVFLEGPSPGRFKVPLQPVVTEPIFNPNEFGRMDIQTIGGQNHSATNISDVMEVIQEDLRTLVKSPESRLEEKGGPFIDIVEQPASKSLRFRYECEGRCAGSLPGINSTPENKSFPTIQIVGYKGRAVVVVSCVTKDSPYRPHPHNIVGKEGCKKGVCTVEINNEEMIASFANLGIQCVKKKDIEEALRLREENRVDPFGTGFSHKTQASSIDLNAVRLCFQAFLEGPTPGKFSVLLDPVVTDPIYDKKAMADLVITKLSHSSASVAGGNEVILLCEKVAKEDIRVRFFEEKNGQLVWEDFGDSQLVHKQVAIFFRTPKYRILEMDYPVQAFIQLQRPSDNATSEAVPFQLTPLDSDTLKRKRQKLNSVSDKRDESLPMRVLSPDMCPSVKQEPASSPRQLYAYTPVMSNLSPGYGPSRTPSPMDRHTLGASAVPPHVYSVVPVPTNSGVSYTSGGAMYVDQRVAVPPPQQEAITEYLLDLDTQQLQQMNMLSSLKLNDRQNSGMPSLSHTDSFDRLATETLNEVCSFATDPFQGN